MEMAILLLIGVIVTVVLAVAGGRARQRDNLAKAFSSLARKHHGAYRRNGPYEHSIRFRRHGAVYEVCTERAGGWWNPCITVIRISGWGSTGLNASIRPRRISDVFRFSTVGSGNIGFNMSFLVRGEPRDRLRQMLSTGVRARVDLLRQTGQSKSLRIHVTDDSFSVSRKGILLPAIQLQSFCDAAIGLCDEIIGVLSVGIELSTPNAVSVEDATCKICGDDLEEDIVLCRKCETPHHQDCWTFNGECSTYACGERRFKKVKPGSLQST